MLVLKDNTKINGVDSNVLGIYKEIFEDKVYGSPFVPISEGAIVVDVGANVGVFTAWVARVPGVRIFAFEPHPTNFQILLDNSERLKADVKCFKSAIGAKEEKRVLLEGTIPGGHKVRSISDIENAGLEIESTTIEKMMIINGLEKIDFLKLDCEGSEGEILANVSEETISKIGSIAMEFHNNTSELNHEEIVNKLQSVGFRTNIKWDGKSPYGYIFAYRN